MITLPTIAVTPESRQNHDESGPDVKRVSPSGVDASHFRNHLQISSSFDQKISPLEPSGRTYL